MLRRDGERGAAIAQPVVPGVKRHHGPVAAVNAALPLF
jgi:hypothetical protein